MTSKRWVTCKCDPDGMGIYLAHHPHSPSTIAAAFCPAHAGEARQAGWQLQAVTGPTGQPVTFTT